MRGARSARLIEVVVSHPHLGVVRAPQGLKAHASNNTDHDRTKHVEVDRHFIKEKNEDGTICIPHVALAE